MGTNLDGVIALFVIGMLFVAVWGLNKISKRLPGKKKDEDPTKITIPDWAHIVPGVDIFEVAANRIKTGWWNLRVGIAVYLRRLLFPIYLFPIKLLTYSVFYLIRFIIKLIFAFFGLILDCIVFPFKSLKNFLKSIVTIVVTLYLLASFFVIFDYLSNNYGYAAKFLCKFISVNLENNLKDKVVRIIGSNSQGSGFFISGNQVLTSFHVISGEPSPKIIFADGNFVTPTSITGDQYTDLAILTTAKSYPDLVIPLQTPNRMFENEALLATGYPLGTNIKGEATIQNGKYQAFRKSKKDYAIYIQTDIDLVEGMSGGPLVEMCGNAVGVNTLGLAGLSMFVSADSVKTAIPQMTDKDIAKITLDPSKSPEEAVAAFYTYLKARRMEDGFKLLSSTYLQKTNFQEWTSRFTDILDVYVIKTEKVPGSKDTVFVKFATQNWVDQEIDDHYYEGTWQTIREDGVFKMLKSKILEVETPGTDWFYE
ncbi:MAG: serine protease [Patescibacteria group bacterium]|jgi:S1-C subfamily serine protease